MAIQKSSTLTNPEAESFLTRFNLKSNVTELYPFSDPKRNRTPRPDMFTSRQATLSRQKSDPSLHAQSFQALRKGQLARYLEALKEGIASGDVSFVSSVAGHLQSLIFEQKKFGLVPQMAFSALKDAEQFLIMNQRPSYTLGR